VSYVESIDEEWRVLDLPASSSDEPSKLLLDRLRAVIRLILESAEVASVALPVDHFQYRFGTRGADQFVFKVRRAHVETEVLHFSA
jgi:hypothetical protein